MKKKTEVKYPDLEDVLDSLELDAISFGDDASKDTNPDDDKTYTFDTHPFYSQLSELGDIEIPDSDFLGPNKAQISKPK
ncbi:MAG: hypothetical protein ACPGUE_09910 [Marinomonas sp.]